MLLRQNALQHYFYVHIDLTQSLSVTPYAHNDMGHLQCLLFDKYVHSSVSKAFRKEQKKKGLILGSRLDATIWSGESKNPPHLLVVNQKESLKKIKEAGTENFCTFGFT